MAELAHCSILGENLTSCNEKMSVNIHKKGLSHKSDSVILILRPAVSLYVLLYFKQNAKLLYAECSKEFLFKMKKYNQSNKTKSFF